MTTGKFPAQVTAFVGRSSELAEIAVRLSDPACRLLTLVGPGGIGKTRLALEAAQQVTFPDGVYFVSLQPLTSAEFIVTAIGEALHLSFYGDQDVRTQLLDYLQNKHLLLVLDNFEHLLDGVDLLSEILDTASEVKLLVTSRERLRLREEWNIDVHGLPFPEQVDAAPAEDYSAVQLFTQSTRRNGSTLRAEDTPHVVQICRLVGGIPLAIELAAAWTRAISCQQIEHELERSLDILETSYRNPEPRHRTMRTTFEPTWQRLTNDEQAVFMRLSVFRGGFTAEAAEQVAGASLRNLYALVDNSLLRLGENGRYDLHELLRQYGEEKLEAAGQGDPVRDAHSAYYANFLEQSWPYLTGSQIKAALAEIDAELDNVRIAWEWMLRCRKTAQIDASLSSLRFFFDERGRYQEGEQIFARAVLAFGDNTQDSIVMRVKLQARQATFLPLVGLSDRAELLLQESLQVLRRTEARIDTAFVLHRLAIVLLENTQAFSEAAEYLQESLAIYAELNNLPGMARVLNWLSIFHHRHSAKLGIEGALERAEQCAWECLSLYQQLDSLWGIATAYLNLGDVAHLRGEYERCKQYTRKSLDFFRETGSYWGVSISLILIGESACKHGAYAEARRCVLQGLQAPLEYRASSINFYTLHHLALAAQIWLAEAEAERAYELIGLLDQYFQHVSMSQRQHTAFVLLANLANELPSSLAAAAERGRTQDAETSVKALIAELGHRVESDNVSKSAHQSLLDQLTQRELEILRLIAAGLSNQAIADQLILSVGTIKWYTTQIYGKLGVQNRAQAVRRAQELHVLI